MNSEDAVFIAGKEIIEDIGKDIEGHCDVKESHQRLEFMTVNAAEYALRIVCFEIKNCVMVKGKLQNADN